MAIKYYIACIGLGKVDNSDCVKCKAPLDLLNDDAVPKWKKNLIGGNLMRHLEMAHTHHYISS